MSYAVFEPNTCMTLGKIGPKKGLYDFKFHARNFLLKSEGLDSFFKYTIATYQIENVTVSLRTFLTFAIRAFSYDKCASNFSE